MDRHLPPQQMIFTTRTMQSTDHSRGFATLATTIILGIALAFMIVLVDTSLSGRRAAKIIQGGVTAGQIAEAGIQKALFCLNGTASASCGGSSGTSYAGETNVSFGGGTFTTTFTGSGATRTITATAVSSTGSTRTVTVDLTSIPPTDDPGFSYALQAGAGGAHMENNSQISGTIYSNGDIDCQSTQAIITGDAYSSKANGMVDSCTVNYHAHADRILDSVVDGDAYYAVNPTGIAGSTVNGTEFSGQTTPSVAPMPTVSVENWREWSEEGTIIYGNYSPADNSTLGPAKIVGDLIMNNNVDVTITGPVWVVGNITTGNNSGFHLDSSFGGYSTVVMADDEANQATKGKIDITNNTGITGSGSATSHILFLSTNSSTDDTSPAISVANNAAGAVFYATNGTLRLQNNAGAKSLAGYRLFLDQNAIVTYVESEFGGEFSNSPAGTWRTIEGTWSEHD